VKATLLGQDIAEVPTTLSPDGRSRAPHLRSWRDGWRHLRFLLLFSPRWLFLIPGLLLMALGGLAMLLILPGGVQVGSLVFDAHTLIYAAAAVLIGFQSLLFGVFTKAYATTEGLMPEDPRLTAMYRYVTLETGLITGTVMVLFGLGGSVWALSSWGAASFGELDPQRTLRLVVPAVLALTLGFQVILSSFFLSVLGLSRYRG
jgi:hypothetical protein